MPTVNVSLDGSFLTTIQAGRHTFLADEPESAGGTDAGPTPYDLLAAALGSCTAMTLHFFARREKLPLEGVRVALEHDRMHAKDCADCVNREGYIHRFTVRLELLGDLTTEQKEKLLSIAKRCPVFKTLTSEIRIDEVLVS
jgi:putative redox protein